MQEDIKVPDFMPVLSKGGHSSPQQGACVMEYVSMIMGLGFTDAPSCTHPGISTLAMTVNDSLADEDRHLLLPLITRIANAAPFEDEGLMEMSRRALTWWAAANRPDSDAEPQELVRHLRMGLNLYDAMAMDVAGADVTKRPIYNYNTLLAEAARKVGTPA